MGASQNVGVIIIIILYMMGAVCCSFVDHMVFWSSHHPDALCVLWAAIATPSYSKVCMKMNVRAVALDEK